MSRRVDPAWAGAAVDRRGRPFDPRTGLLTLAGFATFGVGLSLLYAGTGVGLPCPFRAVTGWDCPLCGGTRLGAALLDGDLTAAFVANPLLLLALAVLTGLGLLWLVELAGGPRVRLGARVTESSRRLRPLGWTVLAGGVAVAYAVARNLWFPL